MITKTFESSHLMSRKIRAKDIPANFDGYRKNKKEKGRYSFLEYNRGGKIVPGVLSSLGAILSCCLVSDCESHPFLFSHLLILLSCFTSAEPLQAAGPGPGWGQANKTFHGHFIFFLKSPTKAATDCSNIIIRPGPRCHASWNYVCLCAKIISLQTITEKALDHGIMGTGIPKKFSYLRPRPDV